MIGGWNGDGDTSSVIRYDLSGVVETLPSLINRRSGHACTNFMVTIWRLESKDLVSMSAGFEGEEGQKVSIIHPSKLIQEFGFLLWFRQTGHGLFQTFLVTGGYQNWGLGYLSSTELLTVGDTAWQSAGPLPSNLNGLSCITLDNVPYALGNLVLR